MRASRITRGGDGGVAPIIGLPYNLERVTCGRGFRRSRRDPDWLRFQHELIATTDRNDVAHDVWQGGAVMGRILHASEVPPGERHRLRPRLYPACYTQMTERGPVGFESVFERTDEAQRRLAAEGIELGGSVRASRTYEGDDLYTRGSRRLVPASRTQADARAEALARMPPAMVRDLLRPRTGE